MTLRQARRPGVLLAVLGLVVAIAAAPAWAVPAGYAVAGQRAVTSGVEHIKIARQDPAQQVNVARIAPDSGFALRHVLSADGGPERRPERTSSMCERTDCIVGVNGDFFLPQNGQPIGAVVSGGQLIRSAGREHAQAVLTQDGDFTARGFGWSGRLLDADLRQLDLSQVNTGPAHDGIALYTPAYGPSTPPHPNVAEVVLQVRRPAEAVHLDRTSVVRVVAAQERGGHSIPPDGAVLVGHGQGAESLTSLADRVRSRRTPRDALLRLESNPNALEVVGGSPVLVLDGEPAYPDDATSFVRGRHPRTMFGRTQDGHLLLVTVDGRQPGYSEGMSLAEGAQLMMDLGAVNAINLDGGGSTTFVVDSQVMNRPSDRMVTRSGQQDIQHVEQPGDQVVGLVERPVASALVLVRSGQAELNTPAEDLFTDFELEETGMPLASKVRTDPASDPSGHTPALVVRDDRGISFLPALAGGLVTLALLLGPLTHGPVRRRAARVLHS